MRLTAVIRSENYQHYHHHHSLISQPAYLSRLGRETCNNDNWTFIVRYWQIALEVSTGVQKEDTKGLHQVTNRASTFRNPLYIYQTREGK
jgi:hypothetical protein